MAGKVAGFCFGGGAELEALEVLERLDWVEKARGARGARIAREGDERFLSNFDVARFG